MKKKNILFWLCMLPLSLVAQQRWTLKECIEYGLRNNRSTQVYLNEKKIADAKAKEALAAHLPTISLSGTIDDNLKVQETIIPAGVFGPTDTRVAFTKKFSTNATAQLDQTFFDFSLITGLKANKYNKQQAELNIIKNEETIIFNISTAYYQIFVYQEQLDFLKANQETYKKQMEISRLQVNKGILLQKELDKITVDYNNAVSQGVVAESNLSLSQNQLKFEMGFPFEDPLEVEHSGVGQSPVLPTSNTILVAGITDYRISQTEAKLLEIDEKRIKAGIYPKLTAYARYGGVGFGDQLGQSFSSISDFSVIGLKLNFPILDFFKRNAQYNQAKFKRINAQENLKIDENRYQLEYQNSRTKVTKEFINIENNKRTIDLAKSVLDVTDLQYQKGTVPLSEWLTAQQSLKEAQNNYLSSLYNYLLAKIELEKASGTLKTAYSSQH
ncbi:TolC family protein [Pedobacter psychrodurus]|uniref:TolC family protein n=1 Tax=Pedobacter psychrodurus TaxID=2530456 RepID=UPI00292EA944|nr:TolC family protein [Pedobacter psychrodurus]